MSSAARLVVLVDREGTIIGSGGAADDAKPSDDTTGIQALPGQSIHVVTAPPEGISADGARAGSGYRGIARDHRRTASLSRRRERGGCIDNQVVATSRSRSACLAWSPWPSSAPGG